MKTPLVTKVRASGYQPDTVGKTKTGIPKFSKKQNLTTVDTKKGESRAFVARDGKPVTFEPIKSPKSKTLAQIGREIRNG